MSLVGLNKDVSGGRYGLHDNGILVLHIVVLIIMNLRMYEQSTLGA